jgi:hypothetical protein
MSFIFIYPSIPELELFHLLPLFSLSITVLTSCLIHPSIIHLSQMVYL